MSSPTRQAIIDCTISLAETKSLRKITVNDIVKSCGITRNTFYYYFHDIYDVLDQTLSGELKKLEECPPGDYDKVLFDLIESASLYKKVWRNLYKTVGEETLHKYVMNKFHGMFTGYLNAYTDVNSIPKKDLSIICDFFEEALFGVMARWLRGDSDTIGTPEEMHDFSERIRVIFDGVIPLMIENSRK